MTQEKRFLIIYRFKKVIKIINKITLQINLVALNTVAGVIRYSKYFAIVADEVQNLTVRS